MDDGVAELQQRLKSAEWKGEHVLVIKSKVSSFTTDTLKQAEGERLSPADRSSVRIG